MLKAMGLYHLRTEKRKTTNFSVNDWNARLLLLKIVYVYGKILRTFNNFCNEFSRVVYSCYLRALRSSWTRLALKAAIGIRKWTLDLISVCNAQRNVYKTSEKVRFFITALFRYFFRKSYTPPHCAVCCTLISNSGCIFWCQLQHHVLRTARK